jgi:hypothetical protein
MVQLTVSRYGHAHNTAYWGSSFLRLDRVVALYRNQEYSFLHCHMAVNNARGAHGVERFWSRDPAHYDGGSQARHAGGCFQTAT